MFGRESIARLSIYTEKLADAVAQNFDRDNFDGY